MIDGLNWEIRRLHGKLGKRVPCLYRDFANHLIKLPHKLGVSVTWVIPFNIA